MGWTVAWWIVGFLAVGVEAAALVRDKSGTLSHHVWRFLDQKGWRRVVFLGGWCWVTVHFFTRGWV